MAYNSFPAPLLMHLLPAQSLLVKGIANVGGLCRPRQKTCVIKLQLESRNVKKQNVSGELILL